MHVLFVVCFLFVPQVIMTTISTPPVTVVCSGVLLITVTVPTSLSQMTSGQHDMVLLP